MTVQNRSTLKGYFKTNAIPTEGHFGDLIESQLNLAEDGVVKGPGEQLGVVAQGSEKTLLQLYADKDGTPAGSLSFGKYRDTDASPALKISGGQSGILIGAGPKGKDVRVADGCALAFSEGGTNKFWISDSLNFGNGTSVLSSRRGEGDQSWYRELRVDSCLKVSGMLVIDQPQQSFGNIDIRSHSIELKGNPEAPKWKPDGKPDNARQDCAIVFNHDGVMAHRLRYTSGTLYLEQASIAGWNSYSAPNLVVAGSLKSSGADVSSSGGFSVLRVQNGFGAEVSGSGGGHAVFGTNLFLGANGSLNTHKHEINNGYGYAGMHATWGQIHFYAQGGVTADAAVQPTPRVTISQAGLSVRGSVIKLGLEENGGGQLVMSNNTGDNKIYLEAFSSDGQSHAAELLLTGRYAQPVPQLTLIGGKINLSGVVYADELHARQLEWQSPDLDAGWSNAGGEYASFGYFKDSLGIVHLRGSVISGSAGNTSPIFELPSGFQPEHVEVFNAIMNPDVGEVISRAPPDGGSRAIYLGSVTAITIAPDGKIRAGSSSTTTPVHLSGITFRAKA